MVKKLKVRPWSSNHPPKMLRTNTREWYVALGYCLTQYWNNETWITWHHANLLSLCKNCAQIFCSTVKHNPSDSCQLHFLEQRSTDSKIILETVRCGRGNDIERRRSSVKRVDIIAAGVHNKWFHPIDCGGNRKISPNKTFSKWKTNQNLLSQSMWNQSLQKCET